MSERDFMTGLRGELRVAEPMAKHVSWRAGGKARVFYTPANVADLCAFLRTRPEGEPILFVGLGSNLLVRDGGFPGTVVMTHHALTGIEFVPGTAAPGDAAVPGTGFPSVARPTFKAGPACPFPTSRASRRSTARAAANGWRACPERWAAPSR